MRGERSSTLRSHHMARIIGSKWCDSNYSIMRLIGIVIVGLVVLSSAQEISSSAHEQQASSYKGTNYKENIGPNYVVRVSKNSSQPATRSGYKHVWPVSSFNSIYESILYIYDIFIDAILICFVLFIIHIYDSRLFV